MKDIKSQIKLNDITVQLKSASDLFCVLFKGKEINPHSRTSSPFCVGFLLVSLPLVKGIEDPGYAGRIINPDKL